MGPPDTRRPLPNPAHTGYLATAGGNLDPPLREVRAIATHSPITSPPVVARGVAYVISRRGKARAVSVDSGHAFWEQSTFPTEEAPGREVTAPALDELQLFVLSNDGYEFVLRQADQEFEWSTDTKSRVGAPPIVVHEITYFIADGSRLVVLNEGKMRQVTGLGVVGSSPSYRDRRLFVANGAGAVVAIRPRDGEVLWRTDTSAIPQLGEAGFSRSPAVAFGHVYAVRDDGAVVALSEKSGGLAWYAKAGGAPGSLAVGKAPGTAPAVYVASRNGVLYAFDARSGKRLWRYDVGGPAAAPIAVVGHTAYVSTARETIGVDVRTRKKTFELSRGPLTPVAVDRRHIYMAGNDALLVMEPTGQARPPSPSPG